MSDAIARPVRVARPRRIRLFVLLGILVLLVAYTGCDLWAGRRLDAAIARLEPKYAWDDLVLLAGDEGQSQDQRRTQP